MRKPLAILAVLVIGLTTWLVWPRSQSALVLYSAVDYGPRVARAFTRKTGIKVRVVTSSTGQLLARITAEGSRPSWDIAWFDGAVAASSLDKDGLLGNIPIDPSLLNPVGRKLMPVSQRWIPTGYTLSGVFVYRKNDAHPPSDFADLLTHQYHNGIGMNNPSISGPTFPLVAAMLKNSGGWPAGKSWLEKLAANGLHIFAKNKYTLQGLEQHKIRVALVQSSAGYALASKEPDEYAVRVPQQAYILPRVIVASKQLSPAKRKLVLAFVKYALSDDAERNSMQHGHADGFFWPVTAAFKYHRKALPDAHDMALSTLDPTHWGPLEAAINSWFNRKIVNQ